MSDTAFGKYLVAEEPEDREFEISNRWQLDTLGMRLIEHRFPDAARESEGRP